MAQQASSSQPSRPIIIIGAGIGGLTTALHLHAHGLTNLYIFESSPQLTTLGVGINVQPHAVLILRNLGLLDTLAGTGVSTRELNYYNRHGDEILREPRGRFAGYKVPQFSIHRGELQMLLLQTVKERVGVDRVALGHAFVKYEQDDESITAFFEPRKAPSGSSGSTVESASDDADDFIESLRGSLLICADGINSTARKLLYPNEGPPHFSGRMLWRGCVERSPYLTGASMIWGGHANQKFIAYPISSAAARRGKSLVNWICELRIRDENDPDTTPPKTNWLETVEKERFLPQFVGWKMGDLDVHELVESTAKVFEFPMCDREPVPRWSFGRLTLLGDAAHPMYPIGSNGASQAVLDAEALTNALLANPNDVFAALQAYQDARLPPTAKIVMANRANGPDHVMQVAEERAPDGFKHVNDVIPQKELDDIGKTYKAIAGFEMEKVNIRADESEGTAEKKGLKGPVGWKVGDVIGDKGGVVSVL